MFEKLKKQPVEVVDITSPAMNSMLGRYFIGQTGMLNFEKNYVQDRVAFGWWEEK